VTVTSLGSNNYKLTAIVTAGLGTLTEVSISVNGAVVSTQSISGPGSYETTYSAGGPDPFTASATATDNLYYTGTGSKTYP
jgi:hypothetical protein